MKPGGRPGAAANRRPDWNQRPGNEHHRGRPRGQPVSGSRPRARDTTSARRRDLPLDRRRGRAVHRLRPPPGLRPQASTTRHRHRRPHRDQPGPAAGPAGRGRDPAAAARPARHGPRLGPHRPRRRRPPRDHPQDRPRRRPHRQPAPARRHRRALRRLVGQTRPRPHPLRARRRHRRPQTRHDRELVRRRRPGRRPARHPRLPAPSTAGNPPPAPASPPTFTCPPAATAGGKAHEQRRPFHVGIHPRRVRRTGTPRLPQVRQPAHGPGLRHDP